MNKEAEVRAILVALMAMIERGRWYDATCCPMPEDRMYQASSKTWWRLENHEWIRAEAPDDCVKQETK